ncbi:MAG: DUF4349 domain-containing protein [Chloroflexota bacterium]
MKKILIIAMVVTLLFSVACGAAAPLGPAPDIASPPQALPGGGKGADSAEGTMPTIPQERMIVRNGEMSLVVSNVTESRDEIARMASRLDGYVVSSSTYNREYDLRVTIQIRVPDDRFEQAMSELRSLAVRVESESTSSQDVTEEYIDLESRLRNAVSTEGQYLALLEKATTVEEMLKIQEALSRVREEIETIKGRMQYLERTTSTSSLTIRLTPEFSDKPIAGTGWNYGEILKSAVRGLVSFGSWLLATFIWVAVFSPLWGAIIGIFYLWRRWRKRRKEASS